MVKLVLNELIWISLEALGLQDQLDPLLNLLRLPVLHEPALQRSSQQILERLEALADALLDFSSGAADLAAWLTDHGG